MRDMEHDLRRALRREDPPPNFAQRLMARVEQENTSGAKQEHAHASGIRRLTLSPIWRWAAVGVTAVALVVGATEYRAHERAKEEAEARAAKRQVMLALRITGSKLRLAKQKVKAVESGKAENKL